MESTEKLNIQPEVGMYAAFARLNYKAWYALGEYVDNSIQSFLDNRKTIENVDGRSAKVNIRIDIGSEEIIISDDAGGISFEDIPRAFKPSKPPPNNKGLSEFGLGMKAASSWFCRHWTVHTKAIGDDFERTIIMDIDDIVENGLSEISIQKARKPRDNHYTYITLRKLRHPPKGRTLTKTIEYLSSIYRKFIDPSARGGAVANITVIKPNRDAIPLAFSGEKLVKMPRITTNTPFYFDPATAQPCPQNMEWKKEFSFDLKAHEYESEPNRQRTVKGWMGILENMSEAKSGFSIFRRKRLIEGLSGKGWKPDFLGQRSGFIAKRIVGELNVIGFDVSHTKDGIDWGGYEEDVENNLEDVLKDSTAPPENLKKQAGLWRVQPKKNKAQTKNAVSELRTEVESKAPQAIQAFIETQGAVRSVADILTKQTNLFEDSDSSKESPEPEQYVDTDIFEFKASNQDWRIQWVVEPHPGADWWYEYETHRTDSNSDDDRESFTVRVNRDHQFSKLYLDQTTEQMKVLFRVICLLALSEHLATRYSTEGAERNGVRQVRKTFNKLIGYLSRNVVDSGELGDA